MGKDLSSGGARRGVKREKGGKEGCACGGEVGKFAAEDGAVHAWIRGEAERTRVGEAFEAGPGGFGGETEEFEDLQDKSG